MIHGYTMLGQISDLFSDFPVYGTMDKVGDNAVATVRGYLGLAPPDFGGKLLVEDTDAHIGAHCTAYNWHEIIADRGALSGAHLSALVAWPYWSSASVNPTYDVPILSFPDFVAWHWNFDPPYPQKSFAEGLYPSYADLAKPFWPSEFEKERADACRVGLLQWRDRTDKFIRLLDDFFQWFQSSPPGFGRTAGSNN